MDYFMIETPRFMQTIERGQRIFTQLLEENHGNTLSGLQVAYLEKSLGLPHSLVAVLLWERGLPFWNQTIIRR